jgi:phosphomannomutase/phosphoglucomutase
MMRKARTKKTNDTAPAPQGGSDAHANGAKSSRAEQRAQEAARRLAVHQQQILRYALIVAVVVSAALSWLLYGYMVRDVEAQRIVELTERETRLRTQSLTEYLHKLQRQLEQEVARPELLPALQANNSQALALLEQSIDKNFYQALKVRLIPSGTAEMERDSAIPIRFAELDFIRRAERGQEALPELALIDEVWLLHVIAPVPMDDQQIVGTLMVTLATEELRQAFAVGDPSMGESVLLQKFPDGGLQTVMTLGQGNVGARHEQSVAGSYLSVRFTPAQQLILVASELPALWLLVVSAITIGSLVAAWIASKVIAARQPVPKTVASAATAQTTETASLAAAPSLTDPLYQSQDILDITVIDEDEDILGLKTATGRKPANKPAEMLDPALVPEEIFRSYDIRGVVGPALTPDLAEKIGQALGSEVLDQGEASMLVARDGRLHSEELSERLIRGITQTGCHVIDIGVVPTPLLYFATFHLAETSSGVMVTASHNPAEYNGFKMVVNGVTLADDAVMDVRARILRQDFHRGRGEIEYRQVIGDYIDRIFSDVALAGNVSLVIDAGNAVTGVVAPQLFEELGCDVTPLYCDLDGSFPNHDPDPCDEKNLQDLIAKVREVNADMGVAFDGDGDRLVVVTGSGKIIWPDQLLMLFARDVLSRNPGADVIFDVKCSRQLNQVISSYGGRPIMWKTGHSPMKAKMIETGALIGGEFSGHIFIKDRWYGFDDGMYAMARLLEIVTLRDQPLDDIFTAFPILPSTPEYKITVPEDKKFLLVQKLVERGDFPSGKATTIDGLRVDFDKGWGLVRASNTSPALTLRFEAESTETLEKIQQLFKRELVKIEPSLVIDF